jgi:hypothetical protein
MISKFLALLALVALSDVSAAKKAKEADPRECEVCINNLNIVDSYIPADQKTNKTAIRNALLRRCTKSGFGSEWKPNPELTDPK